jgi:hypothetical protein
VFGDARRVVVVGGVIVFALGGLVGFFIGRAGRDEGHVEVPVAVPSTVASPSPTEAGSPAVVAPPVVTPPPGEEQPAIGTAAQILAEGDRPVVVGAAGSPCQSLVTPGSLGECGEVPVAGGRVVWVIERTATTAGTNAIRVRMMTFVPDAGGWVEWLMAEDPVGDRWSDVNVLATDLTGDGVAELLVGFRGVDEQQTLEYDIVGYGGSGLPTVLAHPDPTARGIVVVSSGQVQEYGAQYPNGEPACCPPSYLHRTIAFDGGFFRAISSETIPPNAVPASLL